MYVNSVRSAPVGRVNPARWTAEVGLAAVASILLLGVSVPAGAAAAGAPVGLGTAAAYSVLGGQTVTNTGPSRLSGDLGVSPGTAITGFPPGKAAGARHAGDAPAAQAQSDLRIAYSDAAGRAPTASVAGDLVGRTLTAGVYKSTGPLMVSGTVTLDGQGNPNSVFIFQVASTLITASASHITVLNGAQACHVFWQVGSSATLGTTSSFVGTILALTSISVTTSTVVAGRALARNGQVSLDNNTFTTPNCTTPTPTPTPTPPTPTPTPSTPTPTPTRTAPTVTGAAPAQGPISGGTVITVTGSGFRPGPASVTIGGTTIPAAAVTVTSPTTLSFRAPPHTAGPASITVTTPSGTTRALRFTYVTATSPTATSPTATSPTATSPTATSPTATSTGGAVATPTAVDAGHPGPAGHGDVALELLGGLIAFGALAGLISRRRPDRRH